MLSLAQAAKAAGKSKQTLVRWIKSGKLSATRNDDGSYEIDPAELARISHGPGVTAGPMLQHGPPNGAGPGPMQSAGEVEGLHMLLREREETIRDLRRRLDVADEERRRLTAVLADQRAAPAPQPAPARRWWRWR
jgi:hypothetical protein